MMFAREPNIAANHIVEFLTIIFDSSPIFYTTNTGRCA
jgi:hypothetical protein